MSASLPRSIFDAVFQALIDAGLTVRCRKCSGSGFRVTRSIPASRFQPAEALDGEPCAQCDGRGRVVAQCIACPAVAEQVIPEVGPVCRDCAVAEVA